MYVGFSKFMHITSTQVLHKPVDYVLAGQQHGSRPTRLAGRALQHAFGE